MTQKHKYLHHTIVNTHKEPTPVPTIKEQAAAARAAGLKRFTADRPCKRGHVARRADAQGTCITCDYLRNSAQYPQRQTALSSQ
jgi:hypothetical protein